MVVRTKALPDAGSRPYVPSADQNLSAKHQGGLCAPGTRITCFVPACLLAESMHLDMAPHFRILMACCEVNIDRLFEEGLVRRPNL